MKFITCKVWQAGNSNVITIPKPLAKGKAEITIVIVNDEEVPGILREVIYAARR